MELKILWRISLMIFLFFTTLAQPVSSLMRVHESYRAVSNDVSPDKYHNYTEIMDTLLALNLTHPRIIDVFSIGKSWQDRDIFCAKLTNEDLQVHKPKALFVGYSHARERITAELLLQFVVYAVENYNTNTTVAHMLDHTEIYVVAALNVDGFAIVEANNWQRKNARPVDEDDDGLFDEDPPDDEDADNFIEDLVEFQDSEPIFIQWEGFDDDTDGKFNEDWVGGVDLNRNFGHQWNATVDSGSSDPSAEDYRGPAPFSEPETQALRDLALQQTFRYALSFHSGTVSISYPWGYTDAPPPDKERFIQVSVELAELVGSESFQSGSGYTLSGALGDWLYANRSTLAFTCEIYGNPNAWQYESTPIHNRSWEKGVFQFFNPEPQMIDQTIQRWMPVFFQITHRAIEEEGKATLELHPLTWFAAALVVIAGVCVAAFALLRRRRLVENESFSVRTTLRIQQIVNSEVGRR